MLGLLIVCISSFKQSLVLAPRLADVNILGSYKLGMMCSSEVTSLECCYTSVLLEKVELIRMIKLFVYMLAVEMVYSCKFSMTWIVSV